MEISLNYSLQDDYLTEFEVLKFKEMYCDHLRYCGIYWGFNLSAGMFTSYMLMGPVIKNLNIHFAHRFAPGVAFAFFFSIQLSNFARPNQAFTEIVCQPAPHGTYVRTVIKEHFPVWWYNVSKQMHAQGLSLPEMNEYDRQTEIPRTHTKFDASIL